MNLQSFLAAHRESEVLLVLAMIAGMPPTLPAPLDRIGPLVWLYTWVHDALKAFVSFRSPGKQDKP